MTSGRNLRSSSGEDATIHLRDLAQAIVRRKKLALTIFVAVLGLGTGFAVLVTPLYQVDITLLIGQVTHLSNNGVAQPVLLENSRLLRQRLASHPLPSSSNAVLRSSEVAESRDQLVLTVESESPQQAQAEADQLAESIIQEHRTIYDPIVTRQAALLKSFDQEISRLEKSPEAAGRTALNGPWDSLLNLRNAQANLVLAMSGIYSRPTQVLLRSPIPKLPAKRNPAAILAVSAVLAVFLAIFGALFAEAIATDKDRK